MQAYNEKAAEERKGYVVAKAAFDAERENKAKTEE